MIAEATSTESLNIRTATGFARENIDHAPADPRYQSRLGAGTGRVEASDTVAIVGGSFSGMMLAVALALANDAIVLVFEKEDALFARFRKKGHRHLSTNLRAGGVGSATPAHPGNDASTIVPS